jgi:HSP20 family protein
MASIQQRFEVEQPASIVYDAIAHPQDVLQHMPGVLSVTRTSDEAYRLILGSAQSPREIDLQLKHDDRLHRVEWRTSDGHWYGSATAEAIGPARTAVGVHAESAGSEAEAVPHSAVHDALQAFKRALQSREIGIAHAGARERERERLGSGSRQYASDWRDAARHAFARPTELPFALLRNTFRQMDRVWGEVLRGAPVSRLPNIVPGMAWQPDVEVCEQDDAVRICIDVPGVDESQLQVEIDEGQLTVRGERQDERASEPGHRRSEFHYGAFTRRVPLPDGVDPDAARALLRNGVLEVRIPLHRREPRRVPVQHAS